MVIDFQNSDDANSTQLTGKKLKNRGVALTDKDGHLIEIEQDSPSIAQDVEQKQEFFVEHEYGEEKETEQERDERKRRELLAQKQLNKQQEHKLDIREKNQGNPNLKLDKIEQGIENSQNEGRAVHESAAVQNQEVSAQKKEDLQNSVAAKNVPDIRGGNEHGR
jgi:hypothetical protein